MQIALPHKHYSQGHLGTVKKEMLQLGPPTVRAIWSEMYGIWLAVEGSHRLRAAEELGIAPAIEDVSDENAIIVQVDGLDEEVVVIELLEELQDSAPRTEILEFDQLAPTTGRATAHKEDTMNERIERILYQYGEDDAGQFGSDADLSAVDIPGSYDAYDVTVRETLEAVYPGTRVSVSRGCDFLRVDGMSDHEEAPAIEDVIHEVWEEFDWVATR